MCDQESTSQGVCIITSLQECPLNGLLLPDFRSILAAELFASAKHARHALLALAHGFGVGKHLGELGLLLLIDGTDVETLFDLSLQILGLFAQRSPSGQLLGSLEIVHFENVDQVKLESPDILSHLEKKSVLV